MLPLWRKLGNKPAAVSLPRITSYFIHTFNQLIMKNIAATISIQKPCVTISLKLYDKLPIATKTNHDCSLNFICWLN